MNVHSFIGVGTEKFRNVEVSTHGVAKQRRAAAVVLGWLAYPGRKDAKRRADFWRATELKYLHVAALAGGVRPCWAGKPMRQKARAIRDADGDLRKAMRALFRRQAAERIAGYYRFADEGVRSLVPREMFCMMYPEMGLKQAVAKVREECFTMKWLERIRAVRPDYDLCDFSEVGDVGTRRGYEHWSTVKSDIDRKTIHVVWAQSKPVLHLVLSFPFNLLSRCWSEEKLPGNLLVFPGYNAVPVKWPRFRLAPLPPDAGYWPLLMDYVHDPCWVKKCVIEAEYFRPRLRRMFPARSNWRGVKLIRVVPMDLPLPFSLPYREPSPSMFARQI